MERLRIALVLILTITPFISEFLLAVLQTDLFWYRLNGMGAQNNAPKISCSTFSIYSSRKS